MSATSTIPFFRSTSGSVTLRILPTSLQIFLCYFAIGLPMAILPSVVHLQLAGDQDAERASSGRGTMRPLSAIRITNRRIEVGGRKGTRGSFVAALLRMTTLRIVFWS
jgi:hypothetical protein